MKLKCIFKRYINICETPLKQDLLAKGGVCGYSSGQYFKKILNKWPQLDVKTLKREQIKPT